MDACDASLGCHLILNIFHLYQLYDETLYTVLELSKDDFGQLQSWYMYTIFKISFCIQRGSYKLESSLKLAMHKAIKHPWILIIQGKCYVKNENVQQCPLLFNFKIMLGSQETEIVARIKNMTDLSRVCRRCLVRIALRLILILYLDKS